MTEYILSANNYTIYLFHFVYQKQTSQEFHMASQKIIFLVTLLLVSLASARNPNVVSLKCQSAKDCRIDCFNGQVDCVNGFCSCHPSAPKADDGEQSLSTTFPPRHA
ncbi:hypothetical protein ABFX02_12G088800 [Erythranthe guttata]